MNKKIIFVILLFIGISFIIYSFANPASSKDELTNNDNSSGTSEKDKNSIIDKSDILDNDKDDENKDDEDENDLPTEDENNGDENITNPDLVITTPIGRPNNGGTYRPSTPSGGGSTSNNPNGGSNGGNQSSGGNTENNKPGNSTDTNKPGDNNGGNTEDNKPQEPITPPDEEKPNPVPKPPVYSDFGLAQSGSDVENVKISQSENNIVLSGSMMAQPITDKFNTGSYIKVQLVAPEAYTDEQLKNMTVTLSNGRVLTQSKDNLWNGTRASNGRPSYIFTQQFKRGETYSFTISWDGQSSVTYHISYNIKVNK